MHVSLTQHLHREALVEAAEHSTDPDQEACPHHGLTLMDPPGAADKSPSRSVTHQPSGTYSRSPIGSLDNEESFRVTTEECISGLVVSLKTKPVCLSLARSLPFIALHRKRERQTLHLDTFYLRIHECNFVFDKSPSKDRPCI